MGFDITGQHELEKPVLVVCETNAAAEMVKRVLDVDALAWDSHLFLGHLWDTIICPRNLAECGSETQRLARRDFMQTTLLCKVAAGGRLIWI